MKKHRRLALLLSSMATMITACATDSDLSSKMQVKRDLLNENWMRQINLNPMVWTRGADRWFFTGEPNQVERYANAAPSDKAMTIMAVKVPQFTNVKINGCFQVQIVGEQERNSVFILGSNDAVRQTSVQVYNNTVYVGQVSNGKARSENMRKVIVRINVRNLRSLRVGGGALVEGRNLTSDGLVINSANNGGSVLLSGDVNLQRVNNIGGTVSVLGAYTPCLDINDTNGTVNVSGHVGVRSINHQGGGTVSVIGADSNALTINASGGLTTVAGYANLKKLVAEKNSCVFMYWVNSNGAYIIERNNARVGLAGTATSLDINLTDSSLFEGKYLHGGNVYIQTRKNAHANIAADRKIFASAVDNSSIYFYGSPSIVSRYTAGHGVVLPVWSENTALPVPAGAPTFWTMKGPTVKSYTYTSPRVYKE